MLEWATGASLVAGVDAGGIGSAPFRERAVPVYDSVRRAAAGHRADLVVVATPTVTHRAVCDEVAASFPGVRILLEKPAADTAEDARYLLAGGGQHAPVRVGFHMAFSPEVLWGCEVVGRRDGLGSVTGVVSTFTDPYESDGQSARRRFSTSWVDSGINALSVLDRFVRPAERVSLRRIGPPSWSAYEGRFRCWDGSREVQAVLVTSWHVTDAAKTTRMRFDRGAELVLDRTAVAGFLFEADALTDTFGSDGGVPRRESHYRNLYRAWFGDRWSWSPADSRRLHRLLLDGGEQG